VRSYDYANRYGVRHLSWEDVAALSRTLTETLATEHVDMLIGIARAGLFPALVVAAALRRELCPVRITRRVGDEVTHDHPVWRVPVPDEVADKVVGIVDEIADTGETLGLVRCSVADCGAARVVTAALVAHSWADPQPDAVALVTDELVVFPWDEHVFVDGHWVPHPEIEAAIKAQRSREQT
jgi:uncharacterized protein